MDTLALVLTTPCLHIRGIYVERVIDSSKRRLAFQKKVGVGLSVDEFKVKVREGGLTCHVGLRESVALIASGLGLKLKLLEEEKPKPVLAEKPVKTGLGVVKPGYVVGVQQVCRGVCEGGINIKLTFEAYAEADEKDAIEIDGEPKVAFTAKPCVHGDLGTAGVILNLAPRLKTLKPGLRTMDELVKTKAYLKY